MITKIRKLYTSIKKYTFLVVIVKFSINNNSNIALSNINIVYHFQKLYSEKYYFNIIFTI